MIPSPGWVGGMVRRQNICYNVAAFVIPFDNRQHDHNLKKLNLDLLIPRVRGGDA